MLAQFHGADGRVVAVTERSRAAGYWLTGCDGGVFAFGDAPYAGSNPTYQCRGV